MTTNYPPGMTREDWKHIDGEQHYVACPESQDYMHGCSKEANLYLRAEFSPPCWVLAIQPSLGRSYTYLRVDYCPWCGGDLGRPECICTEIDETLKAEAAERKAAT